MNYGQAKAELARSRSGTRVLHRNLRTTLREENGAIIMRLVDTDIITWHPDGRIVLNTGGWHTVTTKRRMNYYIDDAVIYQEKNVWYLAPRTAPGKAYNWDHPIFFAEGITLHADGTITGAANQEEADAIKRLAKQINKYSAEYASAMLNCKIPVPSTADCMDCSYDWMSSNDHLISHLDESYYVPSLLVNAIKACPVAPVTQTVIGYIWSGDYCREDVEHHYGWVVDLAYTQIKSSVRKHMRRALGM